MKNLPAILLLAVTVALTQSPTGPGTFLLKRTATGGPVDLAYFDSVWNVGTGLRRSGDTIFLNYSGVTPGTYGDATHVFQGTVDSFGRITSATSVPITGGGGGGVSSVGLALPSSVFSVSGSPVTTSGTLTGAFQSQSTNQAFMSPNGSSGVPSFRAFLPGDISFLTDSISAARAYTLARIHDSMTVERARVPDSSRASHIADSAKVAGRVDSARVSGLSDSAKVLVRYSRITALHDTADTLRKYARDRIHDSLAALTPARIGAEPLWSPANAIPKGNGTTGLTASSWTDSASVNRTTTTDTLVVQHAQIADIPGTAGTVVVYSYKGLNPLGYPVGLTVQSNGALGLVAGSAGTIAQTATNIISQSVAPQTATLTAGGFSVQGMKSVTDTITSLISKTIVGTGASGQVIDNSAATLANNTTGSAAKWTTARTLTIGSTGKSVDGSANVSWSLAEIGAQAALSGLTTGALPKATSASTIGNSSVADDGTKVVTIEPIGGSSGVYSTSTNGIWVGDNQYGMSAAGGILYLHSVSGTTSDRSVNVASNVPNNGFHIQQSSGYNADLVIVSGGAGGYFSNAVNGDFVARAPYGNHLLLGASNSAGTAASTLSLGLNTAAVTGTLSVSGTGTAISAPNGGASVQGMKSVTDTITSLISKTIVGTGASGQVIDNSAATLANNTTGSAATLTTGRTIEQTQDVSWTSPSFNGSANVTAAATVTGLQAKALPALSSGLLKYNGSAWVMDASSYVTGGPFLPLAGGTMSTSSTITLPNSSNVISGTISSFSTDGYINLLSTAPSSSIIKLSSTNASQGMQISNGGTANSLYILGTGANIGLNVLAGTTGGTAIYSSGPISIPSLTTSGTPISAGFLKVAATTGVVSVDATAYQPALSGGTTGALAKWTSASTLGNATTADLPGGPYQPLENQRLSTSNSPTFATVSNPTGVWRANAIDATISAFYGAAVSTPSDLNWSTQFSNNGGGVGLQALSFGYLKIAGSNVLTWNSTGAAITGNVSATGTITSTLSSGRGAVLAYPATGASQTGILIGNTSDYQPTSSAGLAIGMPSATTMWPFEIQKAGVGLSHIDASGNFATSGTITSTGTGTAISAPNGTGAFGSLSAGGTVKANNTTGALAIAGAGDIAKTLGSPPATLLLLGNDSTGVAYNYGLKFVSLNLFAPQKIFAGTDLVSQDLYQTDRTKLTGSSYGVITASSFISLSGTGTTATMGAGFNDYQISTIANNSAVPVTVTIGYSTTFVLAPGTSRTLSWETATSSWL